MSQWGNRWENASRQQQPDHRLGNRNSQIANAIHETVLYGHSSSFLPNGHEHYPVSPNLYQTSNPNLRLSKEGPFKPTFEPCWVWLQSYALKDPAWDYLRFGFQLQLRFGFTEECLDFEPCCMIKGEHVSVGLLHIQRYLVLHK